MKCIVAKGILLVPIALPCWAQNRCPATGLEQAALRVLSLQSDLRQIHVGEMDDEVPPSATDKLSQFKDALGHVSDLALACEPQTVEASAIEKHLAQLLHANAPEPQPNTSISKDDHRYDEILGAYGHNLVISFWSVFLVDRRQANNINRGRWSSRMELRGVLRALADSRSTCFLRGRTLGHPLCFGARNERIPGEILSHGSKLRVIHSSYA